MTEGHTYADPKKKKKKTFNLGEMQSQSIVGKEKA